jgi:hypothetical protein
MVIKKSNVTEEETEPAPLWRRGPLLVMATPSHHPRVDDASGEQVDISLVRIDWTFTLSSRLLPL